jgi:hypothetical protein
MASFPKNKLGNTKPFCKICNLENEKISPGEVIMKNKKTLIAVGVGVAVVILCLCIVFAGALTSILNTLTPVAEVAQPTAPPTETQIVTLPPTETPAPTFTPAPTDTPAPTATPPATATSTEPPAPTPIPTFPPDFPVAFLGPGDKVLDITRWGPGVLAIIAAQPEDNFVVQSYDQNNELIDLLVNDIVGTYAGFKPINWNNQKASMLQVKANSVGGDWTITYLPIYAEQIATLNTPGTFDGAGDNVLRLNGFTLGTATITANQNDDNFVVQAYDQDLNYLDLLVNEIGAYSGTVILPRGTAYLVFTAAGPWSIQVSTQ